MILQGFVGPSYIGRSSNVAIETLYNWYPERVTVPEKAGIVYYSRPGQSLFAALSGSPVRALYGQDGRAWAVGGQRLYELFQNSAPIDRGGLSAIDSRPATINSSGQAGNQLFITSGGKGDIFDMTTNTVTPITAAGYPSQTVMGTYLDTYFLTTKGNSAQFNISGVLDGLSWSALDFAVRVQASDNIVGIIQFNKVIWLIGSETSEPWYDAGAGTFPFQSVPQVLIPVGCCAPFSIIRGSQALFWLHQSERGRGVFVAAADYNPRRVSTYAIEAIWATYPVLTDAVSYALTWNGHEFVVLSFPTANATWVYDATENLWHQWSYWNTTSGNHDRFRGWVHCKAFDLHLVGDWETGNVYALDDENGTDNDQPMVWERTAPHLSREQVMNFYGNFQLDLMTGTGGSRPTGSLTWSDDGGHTFSTPAIDLELGAAGQYVTRARAAGSLGQSRDRAFRVRISNDVSPQGVMQAYVDVIGGTS